MKKSFLKYGKTERNDQHSSHQGDSNKLKIGIALNSLGVATTSLIAKATGISIFRVNKILQILVKEKKVCRIESRNHSQGHFILYRLTRSNSWLKEQTEVSIMTPGPIPKTFHHRNINNNYAAEFAAKGYEVSTELLLNENQFGGKERKNYSYFFGKVPDTVCLSLQDPKHIIFIETYTSTPNAKQLARLQTFIMTVFHRFGDQKGDVIPIIKERCKYFEKLTFEKQKAYIVRRKPEQRKLILVAESKQIMRTLMALVHKIFAEYTTPYAGLIWPGYFIEFHLIEIDKTKAIISKRVIYDMQFIFSQIKYGFLKHHGWQNNLDFPNEIRSVSIIRFRINFERFAKSISEEFEKYFYFEKSDYFSK